MTSSGLQCGQWKRLPDDEARTLWIAAKSAGTVENANHPAVSKIERRMACPRKLSWLNAMRATRRGSVCVGVLVNSVGHQGVDDLDSFE